MDTLTFENLPSAVNQLNKKLESIELLLKKKSNEQSQDQSDQPLTVKQAASFLSIAVPTLYTLTSRGTIPFMKRGKRLYFSRVELMDYLKEGRKKTNSEIAEQASEYIISKKGASNE